MAFNRNKRSLCLDLKRERRAWRCCAGWWRAPTCSCRVLRPGAIAELGLDYPKASALNPKVVYCSITAFVHARASGRAAGLRSAHARRTAG